MSDTCKSCRFWQERIKEETGTCRRHAPVIVERLIDQSMIDNASVYENGNLFTMFPETYIEEWCGEFDARS